MNFGNTLLFFQRRFPDSFALLPVLMELFQSQKRKEKKKKGETIPFLISRCFTSHVEQIIHFYCILPNALLVSHFWRLTTVKTLIKPISPITNIWILPKAISSVYRYTGGHSFPFPSPHKQIPSLVLGCPEDYCISRVVFFFFCNTLNILGSFIIFCLPLIVKSLRKFYNK